MQHVLKLRAVEALANGSADTEKGTNVGQIGTCCSGQMHIWTEKLTYAMTSFSTATSTRPVFSSSCERILKAATRSASGT